ncbi:MAG TPA: sialidase family protein, partial [Chitinophagaceae bacterium]|nr:sialidase family protein [Chitinophagaceae bacterium]
TRPGKTHLWYALSGELYGTSASGGGAFYLGDGAFKSSDNGQTWTPITSTAGGTPNSFSTSFQGGWRIVSSPVDTVPTCIYMATYGTVFRSIDSGKTWKAVIGNSGNASYFTDIQCSSKGIAYAALSSDGITKGFFRSGNGLNFVNITPSFLKSADRTVICIDPDNENIVYFLSKLPGDTCGGVATANYEGELEYVSLVKYEYLSGDGTGSGGKWTNLSMNLPVTSTNPFDRFNCQGGYDLVVRKQPGSSTLIIGGTNLYRSTDGFTTPNHSKQIGGYGPGTTLPFFTVYLHHHPDQHDLIFSRNNPSVAWSVCDGGIYECTNINAPEVEWTMKSYGYITSQLYSMAIDEVNAYDTWMLAGFQDNGNYVSNTTDPMHSWVMPVNGDGIYDFISPDHTFCVMGIQQGRLVKTQLDQHGYLLARRRIDPDGFKKEDYQFINPFIVDPNNTNLLYTPIGKRLARLNNLNNIAVNNDYSQLKTGWDIFSDTITTLDPSSTNTAEITNLAVSRSEPNVLYIGTNNGDIFRAMNANSGQPKLIRLDTTAATHRLPAGGYVGDIAVDPDSAGSVLVCYSNYNISSLYYTRNYGDTWYYVGGNLEKGAQNPTGGDPSVRSVSILVDENGKRTYFAGTSIGLFSTDTLVLSTSTASALNKTTWKQESADHIGSAIVTDIKCR